MTGLRESHLAGTLGLIGGLFLLIGAYLLFTGATLGGTFVLVFGLILFWWGFAERRKARPVNPESEDNGSHTLE